MKNQLLAHCISLMETSVQSIKASMQELVTEAQTDSKSSAGDKHETGRAMMQQAQEHLGKQLQEAELKRSLLYRIEGYSVHQIITEGSLVQTNESIFFLSAPLGKVHLNGQDVFVISLQSPLGKVLLGKKAGESVEFNNRTIQINSVS